MSATGEFAFGHADAGATLLEMLVVVALSALIGGLVFANFRPALDRTTLEATRAELASTLDRARSQALRTGAAQLVEVFDGGAGYGFAGQRVALPPGVRVQTATPSIRFSSNGLTAGGRLVLVRGARRLDLDVAPGSGVVSLPGPG